MTQALIGRAWTQGVQPTHNRPISVRVGSKVLKGFFDVGGNQFRVKARSGYISLQPSQVTAWAE